MTDKPTIVQVLSKIQKDLKAPKDKTGVGIKYKYRSCEAILEAVKPLLPDDYVIIINDEMVQIGDRYYIKARATISDGLKTLYSEAFAREPQSMASINESQVTGSTSSYARKYALSGLLAIDDNKDADALSADGVINNISTSQNAPKAVSKSEYGQCPKCGKKLELKTTKAGKPMIKCTGGGWDVINKKATGCDFVDWMNGENDFSNSDIDRGDNVSRDETPDF